MFNDVAGSQDVNKGLSKDHNYMNEGGKFEVILKFIANSYMANKVMTLMGY